AWIIYHEGGQTRTMHAYSVEQARDFAKRNTADNKWAWAHVAEELERYDSPYYLNRTPLAEIER
ncbi:UNVERIFIED_CONTAM: hypothetical protein NY603_31175, partial [Bacteroidetes bacterium 56_B9]